MLDGLTVCAMDGTKCLAHKKYPPRWAYMQHSIGLTLNLKDRSNEKPLHLVLAQQKCFCVAWIESIADNESGHRGNAR